MPGAIVPYHTASIHLPTHEAVKAFLSSALHNVTEETFALLLLDKAYRVLHFYQTPNVTLTTAYPRYVIHHALKHKAHTIVLARGFPSEAPHVSRTEIKLVKSLKALLALIDIHVLDLIAVTPFSCESLTGSGRL
ncbi:MULTISPECIES: JAB domain-containing protein [Alcaligenes]|uniref:JAB domain-containing protein n=1 Tax=Alcaligenes TaxID=507 RepID=UPI0009B765A8